jgi:hypothetical protein
MDGVRGAHYKEIMVIHDNRMYIVVSLRFNFFIHIPITQRRRVCRFRKLRVHRKTLKRVSFPPSQTLEEFSSYTYQEKGHMNCRE